MRRVEAISIIVLLLASLVLPLLDVAPPVLASPEDVYTLSGTFNYGDYY